MFEIPDSVLSLVKMDTVKRLLGLESSPPSWWVTWLKFDSTELFSTVNIDVIAGRNRESLFWGIALIVLGLIVLTYDTRLGVRTRSKAGARDRILGLEQRYFLVVFNGLLLYLTLLFTGAE